MKKIDRWGAAFALIGIALWCAGAFFTQRAADMSRSVAARWATGGVSPYQLIRQEEYARQDKASNTPDITLWRELTNQRISSGSYETGASVTELFGSCEDVCDGEALHGGFPVRSDLKGCAVSETLAFDLWGSGDVLGNTVVWNNVEYQVRCVFGGSSAMLMAQVDSLSAEPFGNMRLHFQDKNGAEEAETWLIRAGFQGAEVLDLPLLSEIIDMFVWLPAILLLASVLIKLASRAMRLRYSPLLLSAYAIPALACAALCVWLLITLGNIPAELIPTKWSDFEFWNRTYSDLIGGISGWFHSPTTFDISWGSNVLASLALLPGSTAFFMASLKRVEMSNGKRLMAGYICSVGLVFAAALFAAPYGGLFISNCMWLTPPLWMAADWGLRLHERYLGIGREVEIFETVSREA